MNAILLLLLLAQPQPDASAHVAQNLATKLGEAGRLMEDNPDEAVRLLNELLDDPQTREDRLADCPRSPRAGSLPAR